MNIDKNELRIGNLLIVAGIDREVVVSGLFKSHFVCEDKNGIRFDESLRINYQPIPLTEEWLLRFGFKGEVKSPSQNHSNYYSIVVVDSKYSFSYASFREDWGFYHSYTDAPKDEDNDRYDFISCGIKYVHQFQNLYFALTGEELIDGGNK
jgi:hypothetical protein